MKKKIKNMHKIFSKNQWVALALLGLALLAYLGYRRDQVSEEQAIEVQKETGGILGCREAVKRKNGSFKCIECEDGYRMRKGKCVKHS